MPKCRPLHRFTVLFLAASFLSCVAAPSIVVAQNQGGGGGNNGGGGGNNGGGNNGGGGAAGGIDVNADGLVSLRSIRTASSKLSRRRLEAAAKAHLSADVNSPTEMRLVSLPALEAACAKLIDAGETLPPEIQFLAGLQRIDYVFLYPETGDIVLAGPAEGFAPDATGRMVGVSNGRPTLILEDLLVALRSDGNLGCSIDPVPGNLAAMQRWVSVNNNPVSLAVAQNRYREMARLLGKQTIRVWGVPPASHFARSLVEADYKMKLISIGIEKPRVRGITSHLALVSPGKNSIQRWWFAPKYDAIERNDDETAWSFSGPRARLLAQEELTDADGNRSAAAETAESTQKFAKQFTEKFQALADKLPVFADLQNLIDMAVTAAVLRKSNMRERVGWEMELFGDEERLPTSTFPVPTQTQSLANTKTIGRRMVIGLVSGGVQVSGRRTLQSRQVTVSKQLNTTYGENLRQETHTHWWWDSSAPVARETTAAKR